MEQPIVRAKVELKVSDGSEMSAYVARPERQGRHAAVMVLQEAYGVNSHIRDVSDRLAREGFMAIAPELFHRSAPGFEGDYGNFAAAMPHVKAVTPEDAEKICARFLPGLNPATMSGRKISTAWAFAWGARFPSWPIRFFPCVRLPPSTAGASRRSCWREPRR